MNDLSPADSSGFQPISAAGVTGCDGLPLRAVRGTPVPRAGGNDVDLLSSPAATMRICCRCRRPGCVTGVTVRGGCGGRDAAGPCGRPADGSRAGVLTVTSVVDDL